jgi:hypothetical protein
MPIPPTLDQKRFNSNSLAILVWIGKKKEKPTKIGIQQTRDLGPLGILHAICHPLLAIFTETIALAIASSPRACSLQTSARSHPSL